MRSHKYLVIGLAVLVSGCSNFKLPEQLSFLSPGPAKAAAPALPSPEVTKAWLDAYEPRIREAVKGSNFEVERRENVLVVTAPVKSNFNPDRPSMLMPITLSPITKVAKLLENDKDMGILILGHTDTSGTLDLNRELSQKRARAFVAIFQLSGLKRDRLLVKGMGPDAPRAANDSATGRELNRRVEMILTSQKTLTALLAQYEQPLPVVAKTEAK
ncbi:OmpA family protein [Pseudomonas sp. M30-35]|uniref:OmpA family protein n=1 Tax=Pseudomonas sp. M30-35 TaxID=1981174 RepID=UPI000B3C0BA1|nr:OmpA family protein [Pseudomonas sp. M30-35]ARU89414.1 flagellar motor protein MotB [Pseudomonas sp. M30-35]